MFSAQDHYINDFKTGYLPSADTSLSLVIYSVTQSKFQMLTFRSIDPYRNNLCVLPSLGLLFAILNFFHFPIDLVDCYCFLSILFILWMTVVTCNSRVCLLFFSLSLFPCLSLFFIPPRFSCGLNFCNLDQKLCTILSPYSPSAISHTFTCLLPVYVFGRGMYSWRWGGSKMPWWLSWGRLLLARVDQGFSFPPRNVSLKKSIIFISWW